MDARNERIDIGPGTVLGRCGDLWAVDNGTATVYIAADNMLAQDPKPGDRGILTYEYRGVARVACFRGAQAAS